MGVTIGAALLTGMVIGLLIGLLVAKVRIPSFVVTLAFFLAFQGVALYIVNNGPGAHGDVRITDPVVLAFENSQMPKWAGLAAGGGHRRRLRGREAVGRSAPVASAACSASRPRSSPPRSAP